MHIQRHDSARTDRLEQGRQVADGHGIIFLRPAILSRIAEIWRDRGHAGGARVLQCADQEQQATKLVIRALDGATVKTVNHVDIATGHRIERTDLVFAVFEAALLVSGQLAAQRRRDVLAQLRAAVQGEQAQPIAPRQCGPRHPATIHRGHSTIQ
ncbi:hypothetical protein XH87_32060 [Bradyrhizobium sp. CCBAU 53415]|nr:hypothetical protein [Bradyrhizobium sp. CCBAU 53415]